MKRFVVSMAGKRVSGKDVWHLICHVVSHSKHGNYFYYRIYEFWAGSSSEAEAEALKRLKTLAFRLKSAEFSIIMLREGCYYDTYRNRRIYPNSCSVNPKLCNPKEILKVKELSEVFRERI